MRKLLIWAAMGLLLATTPSLAQVDEDEGGTYLASTPRGQQVAPPLIGLKRRADYLVMVVSFNSDSRDALVRKQEIHAMLLDALGKSASAGLGLSTGSPVLAPLTRDNYQNVAFQWAGREDTSKADISVSAPLTGTLAEAEKRIDTFVTSLSRPGRGSVYKAGGRLLGVRSPDRYRAEIVRLIAADAQASAAAFGPDYRVVADGVDKQVQWVPRGETDVFLYLPYSYRIVAR